MDTNLLLGLASLAVGSIGLIAAVLIPHIEARDGIRDVRTHNTFVAVTYGAVPILAGVLFLAAWWNTSDDAFSSYAHTTYAQVDHRG